MCERDSFVTHLFSVLIVCLVMAVFNGYIDIIDAEILKLCERREFFVASKFSIWFVLPLCPSIIVNKALFYEFL